MRTNNNNINDDDNIILTAALCVHSCTARYGTIVNFFFFFLSDHTSNATVNERTAIDEVWSGCGSRSACTLTGTRTRAYENIVSAHVVCTLIRGPGSGMCGKVGHIIKTSVSSAVNLLGHKHLIKISYVQIPVLLWW